MRGATPIFAGLTSTAAIVGFFLIRSGPADGYTPPQAGAPLPLYATPAALGAAPVVNLPAGALAWVTYQGAWSFSPPQVDGGPPSCPGAPDGVTIVYAANQDAGQSGCWVRGSEGFPGAGDVAAWFVDSDAGSDSNDCQSPSVGHACRTMEEVVRRASGQVLPEATVSLAGQFNGSHTLDFQSGSFVIFQGQRTYLTLDGGVVYWKIQNYTPWDGSAHQEGVAYLVPIVDGGPAFDPNVYNTENGYGLEVQDGGSLPGLGILVGPKIDAGTFITPGGAIPFSFTSSEPATGDVVAAYTLTTISSNHGDMFEVLGGGASFSNVQIGSNHSGSDENGQHSFEMNTAPSYFNGVETDSSFIWGPDVGSAGWLFSYGSAFFAGTRVYGVASTISASMFDYVEARADGYVELSGPVVVGPLAMPTYTQGLIVGGFDGPGAMQIDGPVAVEYYSPDPCLSVLQTSNVSLIANMWCRNAVSPPPPAIVVQSGSQVLYGSDVPPVYLGNASATPWVVAGPPSSGALPIVQTSSLAGILVRQ